MGFWSYIHQDAAANKDNTKGRIITLLFRIATYVSRRKVTKILFFPYLAFYRLFVEWFIGTELPWGTSIGKGLRIFHGHALVIHKATQIGEYCTIRQSSTIGNAKEGGDCPVIGNHVEIGSNVCIIGAITIGDHVKIGAGSVVVKSVPSHTIVAGNPAKVIRTLVTPEHTAVL